MQTSSGIGGANTSASGVNADSGGTGLQTGNQINQNFGFNEENQTNFGNNSFSRGLYQVNSASQMR